MLPCSWHLQHSFLQIPSICVSSIFMVRLHSTQSAAGALLPIQEIVCIDSLYWQAFCTALRAPKASQCHAGVSVVICSACNLASPIVSGILFEILTGRQPMSRYPYFLGVMATLYTVEPLLTRVYIKNVCIAGEKVCHITGAMHQSTLRGQP